MATTESRRDVASRIGETFMEAYNTGEVDLLDDIVTSDFVCHQKAAGVELHGADEYKERIREIRAAFPDFEMSEEFLLVDGDRGAAHYRWGGTHEGEFMGIPATGEAIETTSTSLIRMEGDRLAEMWVYGAGGEVMAQLGVEMPR